jgi:hypothetical protein
MHFMVFKANSSSIFSCTVLLEQTNAGEILLGMLLPKRNCKRSKPFRSSVPVLTTFPLVIDCPLNMQTEVVDITAKLWAADEMTDEEAEELERQSNLLKYKLAMASSAVKEWGMQQALERIQDHENRRKWHDPAKSDQVKKVAMQMAPIAFGFMLLVGLASQVKLLCIVKWPATS